MHKLVKIGVAICITCSLLLFIRATDFNKVASCMQQIGFKFGLLLFVTALAYYFGTLSWKYCFGEKTTKVSVNKLFLVRHVGETLALINPASIIGGDAFKALLLKHDEIENQHVVVSIISSRIIMIITQLLLFAVVMAILLFNQKAISFTPNGNHTMVYYTATVFSILIAGLWLSRSWLKQKLKRFFLKGTEIIEGLRHLVKHHKRKLLAACAFALLHWIFGALEFYFILKFLNVEANLTQALLVDMGVIFFKSAGAFIPGQIGIEEYGNKIMLMIIGIPGTEIWIVASILRRTRQLVWIAFGIIIYFLIFRKRREALMSST